MTQKVFRYVIRVTGYLIRVTSPRVLSGCTTPTRPQRRLGGVCPRFHPVNLALYLHCTSICTQCTMYILHVVYTVCTAVPVHWVGKSTTRGSTDGKTPEQTRVRRGQTCPALTTSLLSVCFRNATHPLSTHGDTQCAESAPTPSPPRDQHCYKLVL